MSQAEELVGRRRYRPVMTLFGALAGLSWWFIDDILSTTIESDRVLLLVSAFAAGFFGVLLSMACVVPLRRALGAALVISAVTAALLLWASYRYDTVGEFLGSKGLHLVAASALVFIVTPFAIAWALDRGPFRDYATLFEETWSLVVRVVAAAVFTGVFWVVLWLCDRVLSLVGITALGELLARDWAARIITGGIFGLSLAVVDEWRDYLSHELVLRLFRLMLLPVTAVTATLVVLLPLRGFREFGWVSPTGTLIVLAGLGVTLVTAVLDEDADHEARGPWVRRAAAVMALLLPAVATFAAYGLWLRVAQHGWTPHRLAGALVIGALMAYGAGYALAVILFGDWGQRIRQFNIRMAVLLAAGLALWLTPLLDAERISARSQLSRFADARVSAEELDLWTLAYGLGRAGEAALAELEAAAAERPDGEVLLARIRDVRAGGPGAPMARQDPGLARRLQHDIATLAPVVPADADIEARLEAIEDEYLLLAFRNACQAGRPPSCVIVVGDFLPPVEGDELMFISKLGEGLSATVVDASGGVQPAAFIRSPGGDSAMDPRATIEAIVNGQYEIGAPSARALRAGEVEILPTYGAR